jgi:hypothetical protein
MRPRLSNRSDVSSAKANQPVLSCTLPSIGSYGSLQRSSPLHFDPPAFSASSSHATANVDTGVVKPPLAAKTRKATGRKKTKRKAVDSAKPSRPLSAYNFFFRDERAKLLMSGDDGEDLPTLGSASEEAGATAHARLIGNLDMASVGRPGRKNQVSFGELGQFVSSRWNNLDSETQAHYQVLAETDKERYRREMKLYREYQQVELESAFKRLESTIDEETRLAYLAQFEASNGKKVRKKSQSTGK